MEKLHNSLDEKLLKMLKSLTPNDEKDRLFVTHWLRLIEIIQKHMLTYLQGIQDQVKKLTPFKLRDLSGYGLSMWRRFDSSILSNLAAKMDNP
jgi:hypothetical protein